MTDEQMLALLRTDEDAGLKAVMSAYLRLVRSVCCGILDSDEDRNEAVNETFYKVWRSRESIDLSRGSLKTFVSVTSKSCALTKLRSVRQFEPLPENELDLGIEVDFSSEDNASVNDGIIRRCVRSMPSPEREVFISRYYFEKPLSQIAREQGLKVRRVEYLLCKGKRRLRSALIKEGILL